MPKLTPVTIHKGQSIAQRQLIWAITNYIGALLEYEQFEDDSHVAAEMAAARDNLTKTIRELLPC